MCEIHMLHVRFFSFFGSFFNSVLVKYFVTSGFDNCYIDKRYYNNNNNLFVHIAHASLCDTQTMLPLVF